MSSKIKITTNAFAITRVPTREYFMYDVFNPTVDQRNKKIQLVHHLQNVVAPQIFNPRLVYDGQAIAYSPGQLNLGGNSGATFTVNLGRTTQAEPGSRGAYQIRLNLTSSAPIVPSDVSDLTHKRSSTTRALVATNLIQLVIRQGPNQNNTNNGRAYFTGRDARRIPGSGIELWRGIFQSVRPTIGKMILTVDTCSAAVYQSGPLIRVCMDFLGASDTRALRLSPDHQNFKKLEKFVKKLRIKIVTGAGGSRSRIKTIRGLVPEAGEYVFTKDDSDRETSVKRYFQEAYGIRIELPQIVGVRLTGSKAAHQDIVPAELCEVEYGQLFKRKVPENITADMVKFSTIRPQERLKKITEGAEGYDKSEFVKESGMKVDTRPLTINATILRTPTVQYGGQDVTPQNGAWNVLGKKLQDPQSLESWVVVNFCPAEIGREQCEHMMRDLMQSCSNLGMAVNPYHAIVPGNGHDVFGTLDGVMQNVAKAVNGNRNVLAKTVLIIILPANAAPIRNSVKHWGDIRSGITTQCLRQSKLVRANNQYWNNIALKLNARLGGRNSKGSSPIMRQLETEPFMIMGADVGHPGPGVQKPSVTSLVYSHDRHATQPAKFVATAVDNFGLKNQASPRRVIFFRDGVSEGEFEAVSSQEIAAIQAAFKDVWERRGVKGPTRSLRSLCHHAVFFPTSANEGDRTGNCHAGSVIDSEITHPAISDFYLQSHSAIQGTSRSSHYIVLKDENFNSDLSKIQDLAYTLCHVYAKATRSVSIPAPVYYADLVCSRGVFHIDPNERLDFDDSASTVSGGSTFDLSSWQTAFQKVNPGMAKNMYFL
ncbi:ribonuclease H-like domain-containing protein [Flammula alnicola]|nr:ribonuclease H-like domain-containing protein [Flammula alnicola]